MWDYFKKVVLDLNDSYGIDVVCRFELFVFLLWFFM